MAGVKNWVKIGDMKTLNRASVHIKDPGALELKLNSIIDGGKDKLQVITDFDRTLTRPYFNGKECLSSFGIFHLCAKLPKEYVAAAKELFNFYRPLEIDPDLSSEQKAVFMEEWTRKEADLLHFKLERSEIDDAVSQANVALREGTKDMLQLLSHEHIPVLVFSAGLGDVVVGVLNHENAYHENMHIISNFLRFTDDGTGVDGLQGEGVIHSFNKNERAIHNTNYFKELDGKINVILMGDVVGDAGMAEGIKDVSAIIKIGYLQDKVTESLDSFKDHFDVVLVNDQTMDFTNELLEHII